MLDISANVKELYKSNNIPKNYDIYIQSLDLHINSPGTNDKLVHGSFELNETLCSDKDLKFGSCEASELRFIAADILQDLKGQELVINQNIGDYTVPFGLYKIDSCKKQDDLRYKEIIAYDKLADIDIDVSEWYNSLFPTGVETYTLKKFRSLLLAHLGIEEIDQTLPNDDMVVEKTIDPTQISGRAVLEATVELNGAFGHINRQGKFVRKILQPSYGLYPSETLYPSEDLYPVAETDTSYVQEDIIADSVSKAMYEKVHFEEYTVKEIDKLIIRAEEDDIGAIVGGDQKRVIDTQTGTSIASTKSDDGIAEIDKIEGASSQVVTTQGKNLLEPKFKNSATIVYNNDGSYTVPASLSIAWQGCIGAFRTIQGVQYTFSIDALGYGRLALSTDPIIYPQPGYYYPSDENPIHSVADNIRSRTFTAPASQIVYVHYCSDRINMGANASTTFRPQVEVGSARTSFEPFTPNSPSPEYPSPITNANNFDITASNGTESNSVTVNDTLRSLPNGVKDTYEVVDGVLNKVQRVGIAVFDGSADEVWGYVSTNKVFYYDNSILNHSSLNIYDGMCSHYKNAKLRVTGSPDMLNAPDGSFNFQENLLERIFIKDSRFSDAIGFKAFLQANPITVLYELETPVETIIDLPSLTSYKGITNITTTANPQVNLTVDFYVNPINTYVIEGNFLVFGKSASELDTIALNAFGNMAKRPYRPYEAQSIGLPYIEVGDALQFATDDVVAGYVLQRSLTGIQALRDEYVAKGNDEREQNFGVNKEIIQLQGKVTRIRKDVEGVSIEVEDLAQDTASKFEQTANQISAEVTRATGAEETLSGSIDVLAGQVVLKVDANGNIGYIDLMGDPNTDLTSILLKADNIDLTGYVSITSLKTPGSVEIDGGNLKAGTVVADSVSADWVYAGNISADQIYGGTITGVKFKSTGDSSAKGVLEINGAEITGRNSLGNLLMWITATGNINAGSINGSDGNFTRINGYTPITSNNIGSQSVSYAETSGYATSALSATTSYGMISTGSSPVGANVYVSAAGNFRPVASDVLSCGTSGGLWSSVWAVSGTIQTSDEREKLDIELLENDERFIRFAKMIVPYTFRMVKGTSGRKHVGFIAQRIEEAMLECEISDMEFAGLIKAPVYAKKIKDDGGNDTDEYDTTSEIIDYTYHLRYDEFVPLLFLWMRSKEVEV